MKDEDLEIIPKEDMDDLKLLKATRDDDSVPFEDYFSMEKTKTWIR